MKAGRSAYFARVKNARPALLALLLPLSAWAQLPRLVPLFDLPADGPSLPPAGWFELEEFLHRWDGGTERMGDFLEQWDGGTPSLLASSTLIEPVVFWSTEGLLCAEAGVAGMVDCHDPVRGAEYGVPPVRRKRPAKVKGATKSLTLGSITLGPDGLVTNAEVKTVAKLRCRRSPLLDLKDYRYLPGPGGRLAVMVLEEDDRRVSCAALVAECGPGGPRYWTVLVSVPACPAP